MFSFKISGEPFFVGRVHHEGSVTPGKVQPSHGVWYEILFKSTLFELLSILIFFFILLQLHSIRWTRNGFHII